MTGTAVLQSCMHITLVTRNRANRMSSSFSCDAQRSLESDKPRIATTVQARCQAIDIYRADVTRAEVMLTLAEAF